MALQGRCVEDVASDQLRSRERETIVRVCISNCIDINAMAIYDLSYPQQRLSDWIVANDLRVSGVRIESSPKRNVLWPITSQAAEEQAGRAHGPALPVLDV